MTRRFRLQPMPVGAGSDWRQTIVLPPAADAVSLPAAGAVSLFIAGCMTPFQSDGQIILLGLHGIAPGDDVAWLLTGDEWNHLISADGVTATSHAVMVGFYGGSFAVTVAVNGTDVGGVEIVDGQLDCPASWGSSNPRLE